MIAKIAVPSECELVHRAAASDRELTMQKDTIVIWVFAALVLAALIAIPQNATAVATEASSADIRAFETAKIVPDDVLGVEAHWPP